MKAQTRKLILPRFTAVQLEEYCRHPTTDNIPKDGVIFDKEVSFNDGYYMVIQVCTSGDPSRGSCWTQGVLFHKGHELGCTDCGESLLSEFTVTEDGTDYTVDVVAEPVEAASYTDGLNPADYDAVEIHGVRDIGVSIVLGDIISEMNDENPEFYSVYWHLKTGGVECVSDHPDYAGALQLAELDHSALGWPLYDYIATKKENNGP